MISWWPHGAIWWTSCLMSYIFGGLWVPIAGAYFIGCSVWLMGQTTAKKLSMRVKAYVIHYTPLKERKAFLKDQLEEEGVQHTFIEEFDKESLSEDHLRRFDLRRVRLSMCSNIMKHIHAYHHIYRSPYPHNLILEDDAVLSGDFLTQLHRGLDQLPDDFDMLFIGDGLQMHISPEIRVQDQYVYKKCVESSRWGKGPGGAGATRCTDSYLVSKKCAGLLIKYVARLPSHAINANSDLWLNDIIRRFQLRIYWLEPTIVSQGTQTGMYDSSHGRGEETPLESLRAGKID